MRTVALLLTWVLGALALGVVAGLALLDPLAGGGRSTGAAAVRRDPPARAATARPVALVVELAVDDPVVPLSLGDGDEVDVVVTVANPTSDAASGIEVDLQLAGATCQWSTGAFPTPFGLPAGTSTARTCRLALTRQGPGSLRVLASHGSGAAEAALDAAWRPPTVDELAAAPRPPAPEPPPAGLAPAPPATCPRLVDDLELPGSTLLDPLGEAVADRAQLLDLDACPSWAAVSGLSVARQQTGEACLPWLISLPSAAVPVGRITPSHSEGGCAAAPATVEVFGQSAEVGAMVITLVAWAVDGDTTRAPALHRSASGAADGCGASGIVAVRNAHQATTAVGSTYRATVAPC